MSYNTLLIKRRLPLPGALAGAPASLSGGELAFNEVDSTLYYGASSGVIPIAGSGNFVNRFSDQTIDGNKTFAGLTTLSSTTFSPNSIIDVGENKITNLAVPSLSSDAATKDYVDSLAGSGGTALESLSTEVYNTFVEKVESETVTLNGGLDVTNGLVTDTFYASSNAEIGGNLTVTGNLSVLGTQTVINTQTINISGTSTQIDVVNNGTATGITVNQTGSQNVAEFYDDSAIALAIVDGGNIGIGTLTPNEKLTVTGNISATGNVYASGQFEVNGGGANTTLYVEDGKIGVNTETPNEALTVVGSISATEDIYARNGTLTGTLDVTSGATFASTLSVVGTVDFDSTLDVVGATTLQSTLDVTSGATFASTVSAAGAVDFDSTLDVVGATTLQSTLDVTSGATFASTLSVAGVVDFDSTLDVVGATTLQSTLDVTSVATFASTVSAAGAVTFDNTLYVAQNSTFFANISGQAGVSTLIDFIIDGGSF